MTTVANAQARLQELYEKTIRPELKEELGLKSLMEVPKLEKIVLNVGAGRAIGNPKMLDNIVAEMAAITGQMPVKTKARISIAGFKLREGMIVGVSVTLRGKKMYEFLDRLINIALPRVRDFNGMSRKSFDKFGNYSMGVKEQIIFPEIHFDKVDHIHGFDITLTIKSKSPAHSAALLEKFKFPLKKK